MRPSRLPAVLLALTTAVGCASARSGPSLSPLETLVEFHGRIDRGDFPGAIRLMHPPVPGLDMDSLGAAVEFHQAWFPLWWELRSQFDRELSMGFVDRDDLMLGLAIAADGAISGCQEAWGAPVGAVYVPVASIAAGESVIRVLDHRTGAVIQEWNLVCDGRWRLRWPGAPREAEADEHAPDPDEIAAAAERLRTLAATLRELAARFDAGEITVDELAAHWHAALAANGLGRE